VSAIRQTPDFTFQVQIKTLGATLSDTGFESCAFQVFGLAFALYFICYLVVTGGV